MKIKLILKLTFTEKYSNSNQQQTNKMSTQQTEEYPIKCDRCNANTYRSHQEYPDTWQYDYMVFCKDCQKEMNEDSDDEEEKKQIDILMSQSVWKIYFGAVLQDIREPNWRED